MISLLVIIIAAVLLPFVWQPDYVAKEARVFDTFKRLQAAASTGGNSKLVFDGFSVSHGRHRRRQCQLGCQACCRFLWVFSACISFIRRSCFWPDFSTIFVLHSLFMAAEYKRLASMATLSVHECHTQLAEPMVPDHRYRVQSKQKRRHRSLSCLRQWCK
jgi:hypothetical protein